MEMASTIRFHNKITKFEDQKKKTLQNRKTSTNDNIFDHSSIIRSHNFFI